MGKVVALHGGEPPAGPQPDADAVAEIEAIAEKVRAGEITGFAIAARHWDDAYTSVRSGTFTIEPMIGRLMMLVHRLQVLRVEQDD